ncbi:hypothetical protein [Stenoxybacter acetivorans]|uniref:hypothetical protein n=1 Tax=Stenoxybacter acetivorans TaxID=422441 RepID=UPI00055B87F9|nr:hypothetical protein [Stenoxybacter acetivorans]
MALIFLAIFLSCIIIFALIVGKLSKKWVGRLVFLVLFGFMFGHDIYSLVQFRYLCSSAGQYIYRKEKADGFYYLRDDYAVTSLKPDGHAKSFLNQGYSYIETKEFTGKWLAQGYLSSGDYVFYRFSYDENGDLKKELIPELKSDYEYSHGVNIPVFKYIKKSEAYVKNRHTGELLGVTRNFSVSLLSKLMSYFFTQVDASMVTDCHIKIDINKSLPESALIPN